MFATFTEFTLPHAASARSHGKPPSPESWSTHVKRSAEKPQLNHALKSSGPSHCSTRSGKWSGSSSESLAKSCEHDHAPPCSWCRFPWMLFSTQ